MGYYHATTYDEARAYLEKARDKARGRPIAHNTRLIWLGDGDIGIQLYHTVIIIWHPDNTQTIQTGGWNTGLTMGRLRAYSHAKVSAIARKTKLLGDGWGIWHNSDPIAPPKVQKCRRCHGAKTVPNECYGPGQWCQGPQWCMPDRCNGYYYADSGRCEHGNKWSHIVDPCEHGAMDVHQLAACQHGEDRQHRLGSCGHGLTERHPLPPRECWRCEGQGTVDHGSYQIPYDWHGEPVVVDPTGKVVLALGVATVTTSYVPKVKYKPQPQKAIGGDAVLFELRRAIPNLMGHAVCPVCSRKDDLATIVIELNDTHHWTREAIADWLESLDLDLSFGGAKSFPECAACSYVALDAADLDAHIALNHKPAA